MLGWLYGFTGVISVAIQAGLIGKLTKRLGDVQSEHERTLRGEHHRARRYPLVAVRRRRRRLPARRFPDPHKEEY